ncbi:MAG: GxxExxY protein [Bacteroidales bacterium]|nr:GxxExxY protein [Candidatus Colimorpha merdihippi]
MNRNVLFPKESYQIVAAILQVHKTLGCGFLEKVYQEALEIEFKSKGIPFEREKRVNVVYKGSVLDTYYVVDFVCYEKIVVELKACEEVLSAHVAQVINYLKVGNFQLGILANFMKNLFGLGE